MINKLNLKNRLHYLSLNQIDIKCNVPFKLMKIYNEH